MGFGNSQKIKNLSQMMTENPRNWENSQLLVTLVVIVVVVDEKFFSVCNWFPAGCSNIAVGVTGIPRL